MELTSYQIDEFQQRGFLLLKDRFSPAELKLLTREVEVIVGERNEQTVMEASGAAVRSVYAPHACDPVFSMLGRDRRLVDPARCLLDGDIYVYQSKLNIKSPFVGEVWEWHQDYVFWHNEDKMPAARASAANISPFARSLILYTYNHVDNAPPQAQLTRPDLLVSRDSRALAVVPDDALLSEAANAGFAAQSEAR